jgi:hypothetical protein
LFPESGLENAAALPSSSERRARVFAAANGARDHQPDFDTTAYGRQHRHFREYRHDALSYGS